MTLEQWQEVMSTNLTAMFNMTRGVIEPMRKQGFGRIINIASINGQKGQFGQANYAATKAGVIGFTKSLALEGARKGITANVVSPGYINTDMMKTLSEEIMASIIAQIPAGRLGETDEVARCVSFLAADEAGFINGTTLSVNGAQYLA
jgi:acetoacetyl-CoA reductase